MVFVFLVYSVAAGYALRAALITKHRAGLVATVGALALNVAALVPGVPWVWRAYAIPLVFWQALSASRDVTREADAERRDLDRRQRLETLGNALFAVVIFEAIFAVITGFVLVLLEANPDF